MNRVIALLCVISFYAAPVFAQEPVDELIATEQKFATTSKEQNTKIAFITFVDSNCIGFNNGTQLNVFREWTDRKQDSSKLTWQPEYVVMSSSGEIGVSTGPWEYRQKSLNDTPVAHGHFTTVWKKKDNGEWKAILDMGTTYNEQTGISSEVKKIILKNPKIQVTDSIELMDAEKKFINAFEKDKAAAINEAIQKDSWISLNNTAPFKNAKAIRNSLASIPPGIRFIPLGFFTSTNYDIVIIYGNAEMETKKKQNYLRVWKRDRNDWKLLMMVIS